MKNRILVAGASGVVGRRLCLLLLQDGWQVSGTTRSPEKAALLKEIGVQPVIVDVFNAMQLLEAVITAQPGVIVHQLTDLPAGLTPALMAEASIRNARIRDEGTRNLVAAAVAAGTQRMVAQSIAFAYAPGPLPYLEDAPLDLEAPDRAGVSARGVASLETRILTAPFEGIILRYGKFYGPGTGFDTPAPGGPVHVDAAADAARRAVTRGKPGIYNVAEDDGTVSSAKAKEDLGWSAGFRFS